MTKKDYQLIAEALTNSRCPKVGPKDRGAAEINTVVDDVVRQLAEALSKDNPRFDRQRFLAACNYMQ
jgi:hypothetical protein